VTLFTSLHSRLFSCDENGNIKSTLLDLRDIPSLLDIVLKLDRNSDSSYTSRTLELCYLTGVANAPKVNLDYVTPIRHMPRYEHYKFRTSGLNNNSFILRESH
jgi:hypothetical protein